MFFVFALIVVFFLILLAARLFLVIVTVSGNSMRPTFLPGDRLLALRNNRLRKLRKGQVALVNAPNTDYISIKRIIGLFGDTMYASTQDNIRKSWEIPEKHCFVQGDNLEGSTDSRYWGPIPVTSIIGTVLCRLSQSNNATSYIVERHKLGEKIEVEQFTGEHQVCANDIPPLDFEPTKTGDKGEPKIKASQEVKSEH